jgi:enoyl-CoA hydratase/carnithine racemase
MAKHVKTEIADGGMTLTMRHPEKKNALTDAMYDALSDALTRAEADTSIRVDLFQGDGDSFTAEERQLFNERLKTLEARVAFAASAGRRPSDFTKLST